MDARIGGGYRMSSTNFSTGSSHSFSVRYTELVAGQRIRHTDTFDDPNLPGEMRVSIDLRNGARRPSGGNSILYSGRVLLSGLAGIP